MVSPKEKSVLRLKPYSLFLLFSVFALAHTCASVSWLSAFTRAHAMVSAFLSNQRFGTQNDSGGHALSFEQEYRARAKASRTNKEAKTNGNRTRGCRLSISAAQGTACK
jgi:hypothetical protein